MLKSEPGLPGFTAWTTSSCLTVGKCLNLSEPRYLYVLNNTNLNGRSGPNMEGLMSLDFPMLASLSGRLYHGRRCLHSESTESSREEATASIKPISGSSEGSFWIAGSSSPVQVAKQHTASEGVCTKESPGSCYLTRDTSADQQLSWNSNAGRQPEFNSQDSHYQGENLPPPVVL